MPFRKAQGNLLRCSAEALVNPVNCVGVMGKGLALAFKREYPANFEAYAAECKAKRLPPGSVFTFREGGRWILNFATKDHWRDPSKLEWIERGLPELVRIVREKQIQSLALPPLGTGLGGLAKSAVEPLIEAAFQDMTECGVVLMDLS